MTTIRDAAPASLRKPAESSRLAQGHLLRAKTLPIIAGAEARAISVAKSRFARMPQEPEDARLTGVTRSLNRRLLALNLPGSLGRPVARATEFFPVAKIA